MKAVSEKLNSLQIYHKGRTPYYILHVFSVEDIPIKSFHTLFSLIYVLDVRLQKSGGAGPPNGNCVHVLGCILDTRPSMTEASYLYGILPQVASVHNTTYNLTMSLVLILTWKRAPSHQTGRTLSNTPSKWPQPKMSIWQTLGCGDNTTRERWIHFQIPLLL